MPSEKITEMCRKYSRGRAKVGKGSRDSLSKITKSSTRIITTVELGNLLGNFKTDILSTLGSHIDTSKAKKKHEENNETLETFSINVRKIIHLENVH